MAAQQTELVDFYVTPFEGVSSAFVPSAWFVHRGSPNSTYVAVCDTRDDAITRAVAMSKSQRLLGKTSVVYVREAVRKPWRIHDF